MAASWGGTVRFEVGIGGEDKRGAGRELLDLAVYDIHLMAETQGVELGATDEQRSRSLVVVVEKLV